MAGRRYAKGYNSKAECQRCGFKMNYSDLLDDGQVPGLRVCADCWEPWHPQLDPIPADDAIALQRPSPDISISDNYKENSPPIEFDSSGFLFVPVAIISYTAAGLALTFSGSTDSNQSASYSWDFGDGGVSSLQNPVNTYLSAGDYVVTLTVTLADGYQAVATETVTVAVAFQTWSKLADGLGIASPVASLPRNNVATDGLGVWMATEISGYVSLSTDNGLTWAVTAANPLGLNLGNDSNITALGTNSTGTWIVGSFSGKAARTTDNGATWTALPQYLNANALSATIRQIVYIGGNVWVSGSDAGYGSISTDDGVTWTQITPVGFNSGLSVAANGMATDGQIIIRAQGSLTQNAISTDKGVTWSALTTPISPTAVASPSTNKFVIADNLGNFSYSVDGGTTWSASKQIGTSTKRVYGIAIASGNRWLTHSSFSDKEMWYTDNQGVTWTQEVSFLPSETTARSWKDLAIGKNDVAVMVAANDYNIRGQ